MRKSRARRRESQKYSPVLKPLAAAILAALCPAVPAMAQQAEEDQPQAQEDQEQQRRDIEQVIVTGSRLRKDTFSSAAPMVVVEPELARARGISNLADLLQTSTVGAVAPQVTPAISAGYIVNGGLGTTTLSLRGLGVIRTLVLLNGRRVGPSGVKGYVSAFDLNTIPLASIERVEILKDGASSIYGSDAIAGVVNIITRKSEGGEFNAFYSQPAQSGGEQMRVNGSWGAEMGRGYFRITGDYTHQEILETGDRDYFGCPEDYVFDATDGRRADLLDPRTGQIKCGVGPWGHVWVYDYASSLGDGTTNVSAPPFLLQYDADGALAGSDLPPLATSSNPYWLTTPPGWFPVYQDDRLSNAWTDTNLPMYDETTLVPESDTVTAFLEGEYQVTDDTTAYAEVLLSRRETTDFGWGQFWTYLYTENFNFANFDVVPGSGDPNSAGWQGAMLLSPLMVTGHNDERVTVDYQRFVAGLRGDMQTLLPDWHWDLSVQYSFSDGEYENDRILTDALAMTRFRTSSCVGEVTPISNRSCVDIPWLDPAFLRNEVPGDVANFLFATETGTTEYKQLSVDGFISGDVMELPAGTAAVALGFQYRNDEIVDTPGPISQAGNAWLASAAGITAGDATTKALFAEVAVPLLSDLPAMASLEFTGSVRFTNVDAYGSEATYKAGLNWALTDSLRLRSTYGTSFRTPTLYELYLAEATSFMSPRSDPCYLWGAALENNEIPQRIADNCAADGVPPDFAYFVSAGVLTGGGLGVLEAETSDALTAGFVWRPRFADLSLSVDYIDIEVKDEIDIIGAENIVFGCYNSLFFPDDPLCDLFEREGVSGGGIPHGVTTVHDSYINVANQRNRSIDVLVRYAQDTSWGTLTIDTQHTFMLENSVGRSEDTVEEFVGRGENPEWVANLNVTLQRDPWSFFWGVQYVDETDNYVHWGTRTADYYGDTVNLDLILDSTLYHGFSVSREFDTGYTARLGVANAFDEEPGRTSHASDVWSQYDLFGRRFFLDVTKAFGE